MIIAHTIKGKGVSIFEGKVEYHGIAPTKEELEIALKELEA
jgi:transketolase